MYKLENGKLVEAPAVWKGIVGYNKDLDRLVADGWKPKVVKGEGEIVEYIEHADHIVLKTLRTLSVSLLIECHKERETYYTSPML
jgi:hypothetical protein